MKHYTNLLTAKFIINIHKKQLKVKCSHFIKIAKKPQPMTDVYSYSQS